jgi:hypothetical protein
LFVVDVTDMRKLHPQLEGRGGELTVKLERARIAGARTCETVEGRAETDVLAQPGGEGALAGWRGPELEGVISCEGGDLTVRLAGADDKARVSIEARIDLASRSTFVATVQTEDPQVRLALGALGFSEQNGAFAYTKNTSFKEGQS